MAGLLAARVLANHFEQVTIVERDALSDTVHTRKGVGGAGQHLPTDEAGFAAFARSLRHPIIADALAAAEPVTPIRGYRARSTAVELRAHAPLAGTLRRGG
jgi:hypothetical protein